MVENNNGTSTESTRLYQYQELKTDLGLYFEKTTDIRFFHEEWKLASYINLTGYEEEYTNIQQMGSLFNGTCHKLQKIKGKCDLKMSLPPQKDVDLQ